ncbi:hypothetical protein Sden_2071 [Shewanella denitrificans OS217]|jgi:hypothetical protein|uniref:Uncharacterized protein n=1 Tax=Shewanella denitrificans (strain OS217 / ATCC BAA-1090 / DSM 15013) TaxID=318161 RepID=Q12MH3_SHEDO|nr:hypothetical protein Sden_2071 [Shewanella denitrificans OS217]
MKYNIFWVMAILLLWSSLIYSLHHPWFSSLSILLFFIISILNMTVVKCKACNLVAGYWGEPTNFKSFFTNKCKKCMNKEKA